MAAGGSVDLAGVCWERGESERVFGTVKRDEEGLTAQIKKKYFQPTLSVSVDGSIIVFSPVDRTT